MLARGTIFQSIGRVIPQGLGFIMGIIVVRISGIEVMGKYAEYMAILSMTFGVLAAGINGNYLRSGSIRLYRNSIWGLWISAIPVAVVIIPVYILYTSQTNLISQMHKYISILFFLVGLVIIRTIDLHVIKLRFLNKDKFAILPRFLPYIVIIILLIIILPKDIMSFAVIFVIGWMISIFFLIQGSKVSKRMPRSLQGIKNVFYSSFILSGTTLATQVYANVDQLMIAKYSGESASGAYKIAISFSSLVMPLIGVFSFMYLSQLKRLIEQKKIADIRTKFWRQIVVNSLLGLCFFFFFFFTLEDLIPLIYGNSATGAVLGGIILSIGITINVVSMVISYSLLAINKEKSIFFVAIGGAILNLILNYVLIPNFGIPGAAVASTGTQFLILLGLLYLFFVKVDFFKLLSSNHESTL